MELTNHQRYYRNNPNRRKEINDRIRQRDPIQWLLYRIKCRCKKEGIPFGVVSSDIPMPTHCPVLGMELNYLGSVGSGGEKPPNTASIDRIIPSLGYVRGNVVVVSWRANSLKKDATLKEMEALYTFYKNIKTVTEEIYGD
jgi:hypothetical protein